MVGEKNEHNLPADDSTPEIQDDDKYPPPISNSPHFISSHTDQEQQINDEDAPQDQSSRRVSTMKAQECCKQWSA